MEIFEQAGFTVWWEKELVANDTFDGTFIKQLKSSSSVVVLWSKHSVESRWVNSDASVAVERGNLLPVLLEDVELPDHSRQIQAVNLMEWQGDSSSPEVVELLRAIERRTGRSAPPGIPKRDGEMEVLLPAGSPIRTPPAGSPIRTQVPAVITSTPSPGERDRTKFAAGSPKVVNDKWQVVRAYVYPESQEQKSRGRR